MTNKILENYEFGDIKEYLFFLEPTAAYDNGVFYTFDTEAELLKVIKEELLPFCFVDEDEIQDAQKSLEEILPNTIKHIDESVLAAIDQLLTQWKVKYIGTLDGLVGGDRPAEKSFRSEFREQNEMSGCDKPIQASEIDDFKTFLLPEWER
jgi:tetrahydromethanopterin S-methyltransferase subunit G